MSYTVIRRSGEEVTFDISKIAAAITKAFEAIQPVIEEATRNLREAASAIADMVEAYTAPLVSSFRQSAFTLFHSIAHFLTYCYYSFRDRILTAVTYDPLAAVYYSAILTARVKTYTLSYLGHVSVSRHSVLLRRQDRGSTDSVSDDDNNFTSVLTLILNAS